MALDITGEMTTLYNTMVVDDEYLLYLISFSFSLPPFFHGCCCYPSPVPHTPFPGHSLPSEDLIGCEMVTGGGGVFLLISMGMDNFISKVINI